MARDEHEPQQVVADVTVDLGIHLSCKVRALGFELTGDLLVLVLEGRPPPYRVDAAPFGGDHEPGARVVRDARLGPLLQGRDERVLGELFCEPDVAHRPRQSCDESGRLDPPDRLDRAMRIEVRHEGRNGPDGKRQSSGSPAAACTSGGNSEMSMIWRSSIAPSGCGQRAAHSTASAFDFTSMTQ